MKYAIRHILKMALITLIFVISSIVLTAAAVYITISATLSASLSVLMGKSESYRLVIRILASGCVIAGGVHYFTQDYLWSLTAFGVSLVVLGCAVWLKALIELVES